MFMALEFSDFILAQPTAICQDVIRDVTSYILVQNVVPSKVCSCNCERVFAQIDVNLYLMSLLC